MELSLIINNPLFLIIIFFFAGMLILSFLSSIFKKGGEATANGITHMFEGIFSLLRLILTIIRDILYILFLVLSLSMAYLFKKK